MVSITDMAFLWLRFALSLGGVTVAVVARPHLACAAQPNIILVVTDDQGYNDLGCFGSKRIRTPHIDRMADEGVLLTDYYSTAPLCAPSRASLMTGCYSQRLAAPDEKKRFHTLLDASEVCLPELLRQAGYATCAIGKWHLAGGGKGCVAIDENEPRLSQFSFVHPEVMPCQKGFDHYFGIPYSNDMNPVVLVRDNQVIEYLGQTDKQAGVSTRYTDEALNFIDRSAEGPFFLYLAHNMPHTPLYPHADFAGKSAYGLYGDCIEEIDWNMGRILDKLSERGIDDRTLVLFTSDNGPWIERDKQGRNPEATDSRLQSGRADPLRGFKMTTHEGGVRVPCVIRFPTQLPAGRTESSVVTSMDILPTMIGLAGGTLPSDRVIDGRDMWPVLTGQREEASPKHFYYYKWTHLQAVRSGDWKLVLPRTARPAELGWYNRLQEEIPELTLYHLTSDIGETANVAADYPAEVDRLLALRRRAEQDLGDGSRGILGTGRR